MVVDRSSSFAPAAAGALARTSAAVFLLVSAEPWAVLAAVVRADSSAVGVAAPFLVSVVAVFPSHHSVAAAFAFAVDALIPFAAAALPAAVGPFAALAAVFAFAVGAPTPFAAAVRPVAAGPFAALAAASCLEGFHFYRDFQAAPLVVAGWSIRDGTRLEHCPAGSISPAELNS